MSPIAHGWMYPEAQSSHLRFSTLRVLVDPASIRKATRALLDIDTLRIYLRDLESPYRIVLMLPADVSSRFSGEYAFMEKIGVDVLPSAQIVVPDAAATFPETEVARAGLPADLGRGIQYSG